MQAIYRVNEETKKNIVTIQFYHSAPLIFFVADELPSLRLLVQIDSLNVKSVNCFAHIPEYVDL